MHMSQHGVELRVLSLLPQSGSYDQTQVLWLSGKRFTSPEELSLAVKEYTQSWKRANKAGTRSSLPLCYNQTPEKKQLQARRGKAGGEASSGPA